MEVTVSSEIPGHTGKVVVATDPNHSVDSLITAFCIDKGIPHRKEYVLRNGDHEELPSVKQLSACEVVNGDVLYLTTRDSDGLWCCGCSQWWLLAFVCLLIGIVGIVAISVLKSQETKAFNYGVVLDAGSSHTQIYVYQWPADKTNQTGIVSQLFTNLSRPGISNYTEDPSKAAESVENLLHEASNAVSVNAKVVTPVYLGATAGMRLLSESDNKTCTAIMTAVKGATMNSGFLAEGADVARILDGKEEGAFSWVTVNYLNGSFGVIPTLKAAQQTVNPRTTLGALDLGGASTQISFAPADVTELPIEEAEDLLMYGEGYRIYTHSYLCHGLNEAHRKYQAELVKMANYSAAVQDPCRPLGNVTVVSNADVFEAPCTLGKSTRTGSKEANYTFTGTSNTTVCASYVRRIFNFSAPCSNPPCTFDGVHQPPLYGNYLAFSGYYFVMDFLNLTKDGGNVTLEAFEAQLDALCAKNWTQVSQIPPSDFDVRDIACFNSHYVHTLLVDAYGFNGSNWDRLKFAKKIHNTELGWSVGFMLNTTNSLAAVRPQPVISTLVFVLLLVLFAIFIALFVAFACHARHNSRRASEYQRLATYGSI